MAPTLFDNHMLRNIYKKIELDAVLPFCIVPLLVVFATFSLLLTVGVMFAGALFLIYISKSSKCTYRNPFYIMWTISSSVVLFLIFEFDVVTMLEITQVENFVFLVLILITAACFYHAYIYGSNPHVITETYTELKMKGVGLQTMSSRECAACLMNVGDRYFHSLWLGCCINSVNYTYYFLGLLFADSTLLYGANLGLTTVCQPYIFYKSILMPQDCSDVYYGIDVALCFVASLYALAYASVITLVIVQQIFEHIKQYMKLTTKRHPEYSRLDMVA